MATLDGGIPFAFRRRIRYGESDARRPGALSNPRPGDAARSRERLVSVAPKRRPKDAVFDGASDGVYAWLDDHPITAQEPFFDAVDKAVTRWLDSNCEDIVAAIASRAAGGIEIPAQPTFGACGDR
jgi:hypothetical protein